MLTLINSYNVGEICTEGEKIGGIIGSIDLDNTKVSIIESNYYNTDTCLIRTAVGEGAESAQNIYGLKNWEMIGSNAAHHMLFEKNTNMISFNGGISYPGLVGVNPDSDTYYPKVINMNERAENIATIISIFIVISIVAIVIGKSRQ